MIDSSSSALLDDLNTKANRIQAWPAVALVAAVSAVVTFWVGTTPFLVTLGIGLLLLGIAGYRDRVSAVTVLLYDLDDSQIQAYTALVSAFEKLSERARIWHVEATGVSAESRRDGIGIETFLRKPIVMSMSQPPRMRLNIDVPRIPVGRQTLFFLPDRLLVYDGLHYGSVGYESVEVTVRNVLFLERELLPSDAEIVEHTWEHINKDGTRDRRYLANRELPVVRYEDIHFQSNTGLDELIQVSRPGDGLPFSAAIYELAKVQRASPASIGN